MLTRLRFKNFKAGQDSGDIRLAPLTVLFGANSAGKTSIPQLLLLLKQTAESSDRQRALQLGDGRTPIDLGTYDDAVHNHDTGQPMEIELDWTLGETLQVTDPLSRRVYAGATLTFQVSIGADKRRGDEHGVFWAHRGTRSELTWTEKQTSKPSNTGSTPCPAASTTGTTPAMSIIKPLP